jgi:phosphoribosylanthranilate isomerase
MGYHLRVKICGITEPDDLDACVKAGTDAVGLNFHPPSPRSITVEKARALLAGMPPFVEPVGVFVRQRLDELHPLLGELRGISTVQVHGEPHEMIPGWPVRFVPAFQVRDADDLLGLARYLDRCRERGCLPSAILVDGHAAGLVGGTGQQAPWDLLAEFHPEVPLILAGGLTPDNVAEAVRRVRPYAVDVASGVEASPGRKEADLVRRFIDRAREAAASEPRPQ